MRSKNSWALLLMLLSGIVLGGFIGEMTAKIPGLDCVSIGPDMADVHTTEESFSIESVARMWDYLLAVLAEKQQDR